MAGKRGVSGGDGLQPTPEEKRPTKAMYLFPKALLRNVEFCAWKFGKTRSAIVQEAIAKYLRDEAGVKEPFRMPKDVTLKWD